jgi:hypothetical protein
MYVYEEGGRISGLIRVERESTRDEWTIVELDAVGMADAGDIRYRLVNQLLREGARRGAARFHVACADVDGNVELMMQAGFIRYGEERIMFRPDGELPKPWSDKATADAGSARPSRSMRWRSSGSTWPRRPSRSPGSRPSACPTGNARATIGACPARASRRSCGSLTSRHSCRRHLGGGKDGTQLDGFLQVGVAKEDQPHYLKVLARPEADATALIGFGLGIIEARTTKGSEHRHDHGVIAPVRTYEGPIDNAWRKPPSDRSPASRCS